MATQGGAAPIPSGCTDCLPTQDKDICNGVKTPTDCVYSRVNIPSLSVEENEELTAILGKIGLKFRSVFTSIEGYDPNEFQALQNVQGQLRWVTFSEILE